MRLARLASSPNGNVRPNFFHHNTISAVRGSTTFCVVRVDSSSFSAAARASAVSRSFVLSRSLFTRALILQRCLRLPAASIPKNIVSVALASGSSSHERAADVVAASTHISAAEDVWSLLKKQHCKICRTIDKVIDCRWPLADNLGDETFSFEMLSLRSDCFWEWI